MGKTYDIYLTSMTPLENGLCNMLNEFFFFFFPRYTFMRFPVRSTVSDIGLLDFGPCHGLVNYFQPYTRLCNTSQKSRKENEIKEMKIQPGLWY